MLDLTKGDKNNLEGKVEVYAKIDTPEGEKILSAFATIDALAFIEELGLSSEEGKDITEKMEEMKQNLPSEAEYSIPVFTTPPRVLEEVDIMVKNCDAVYVGKFLQPAACTKSIFLTTELYVIKYHNQMLQKAGAVSEKIKPEINHSNVQTNIREYLLRNYVIPMLDSNRHGESREFSQTASNFVSFSQGSKFERDVLELCALMRTKNPDLELIDLYLNKIEAIRDEKYETAAKIRDQIAQLYSID